MMTPHIVAVTKVQRMEQDFKFATDDHIQCNRSAGTIHSNRTTNNFSATFVLAYIILYIIIHFVLTLHQVFLKVHRFTENTKSPTVKSF